MILILYFASVQATINQRQKEIRVRYKEIQPYTVLPHRLCWVQTLFCENAKNATFGSLTIVSLNCPRWICNVGYECRLRMSSQISVKIVVHDIDP